jgi:serine/threonine protein kinase
MVLRLPRDQTSQQHLTVLKRVSQHTHELPRIIEWEAKPDFVDVVTHWTAGVSVDGYMDNLRKGKRPWPSPTEAFKRYRYLVHALAQLYEQAGIVHGDLTPENLIITAKPPRLVMIDFGSAWAVEQSATKFPGDGFTPPYAAPERLLGESSPGQTSDQFSATVILYEMLTGECPYGGIGGAAGLPKNRADHGASLTPPSQKAQDTRYVPRVIWREIDAVAEKGLALNPPQRFASVAEWRDAVDRVHRAILVQHPDDQPGAIDRVVAWLERVWRRRRSGDSR